MDPESLPVGFGKEGRVRARELQLLINIIVLDEHNSGTVRGFTAALPKAKSVFHALLTLVIFSSRKYFPSP